MKNMFKDLWGKVMKSVEDHLGKTSQVRVQSYFVLIEILLTGIVFLAIEIGNAWVSIHVKGETYAISTEAIVIFGMVLSHHLIMLGLKKSSEATPFPSLDKKMETTKTTETTETTSKEETTTEESKN